MASCIFKPLKSATNNMRFTAEFRTDGKGLPRKQNMTARDMTTLTPGQPRNWPIGTDSKAPLLPGEA